MEASLIHPVHFITVDYEDYISEVVWMDTISLKFEVPIIKFTGCSR